MVDINAINAVLGNITVLNTLNDKYIVKAQNKKYIIWQAANPILIDLVLNYEYTPKIIYHKEFIIAEWLENSCYGQIDELEPKIISSLHKLAENKISNAWLEPIDKMWNNLPNTLKIDIKNQYMDWPSYKSKLIIPNTGNLCHCDLHPGNILIKDNKYYLIDLEWLNIAPKEFDLAMLKQFMDANKFQKFLDGYDLPFNNELLEQYYKLCLYRCGLWALDKSSTSNIPKNIEVPDINVFRQQLINNTFSGDKYDYLLLGISALFSSIS